MRHVSPLRVVDPTSGADEPNATSVAPARERGILSFSQTCAVAVAAVWVCCGVTIAGL